MRRLSASLRWSAPLPIALPFAILLFAACGNSVGPSVFGTPEGGGGDAGTGAGEGGDDAGVAVSGDGGDDGVALEAGDAGVADDSDAGDAGDGPARDGSPRDPPNPSGLGPAPVNLGSANDLATAGSYVLLAKTGITNVTGSAITGGHMGLSPAAATFITGFSLIADSSNVFSTSASVVAPGKVYASNYATPTPANLTRAILGMQTAYTDAAGRSNPGAVNAGAGNIGGLTLAPGLYKWGTGVTIPTDVTLAGGANDVWIFQIAQGLDISTAKNVILSGGAQAQNIFWQVAGDVMIHANAHFEGSILCQTQIVLQTNASMHGRALAQSLIALDNNAVTAP